MAREGRRRWRGRLAALALALALVGCSGDAEPPAGDDGPERPSAGASSEASQPPEPSSATAEPTPTREPRADPALVRVATATAAVRHLAGVIGPRPGTAPAYFRAADWVQRALEGHGWQVRRQPFPVPAGVSWGVPVEGGRSVNLVATRGDVRPGRPWLLVGAHLDTVPQSPGAEDNASGVGALLAVAEALAGRRTRLPVVLVAFGAEEPRGDPEDHHYGSRAYVADLSPAERRSLRGAVSLDRVGVGDALVIGSAEDGDPLRAELVAAARAVDAPHVVESGQRSSDHWSFVRAGLPGVRLGSTPYAGYHSPADVPPVVSPAQLDRTARTVVSWLR